MRVVVGEPVAEQIRRKVRTRPQSFFRLSDFYGSRRAVESALSRLAADGELIRVRHGLYWRGKETRFGMTHPSKLDIALVIAGEGSGPSGITSAHVLGFTTQVPTVVEVAVPGRVPEHIVGVKFTSRSYERREHKLTPIEVAVLEILRDPGAAEVGWLEVKTQIRKMLASSDLRFEELNEVAKTDSRVVTRKRWLEVIA